MVGRDRAPACACGQPPGGVCGRDRFVPINHRGVERVASAFDVSSSEGRPKRYGVSDHGLPVDAKESRGIKVEMVRSPDTLSVPPERSLTRELLELFGLADRRDSPVAALSGGMRRALDIVRGVLHEPRILFLDEPTIGLDLPNRRGIWRFIERLRARTGMTVLLTTHYLEEADGCDRVAFIRRGRLVESGAPRTWVERLGRHMLEVEGPDLDGLAAALEAKLGAGLREGDVAYFRCRDEDVAAIARLQAEMGSRASAWRVRRRI